MKLQLYYPLDRYQINQKFGENANNFYAQLGMVGHNGIDLYALDGTNVYASHDGIVTYAGEDGSGGLTVVIRTLEKYDYKDTECQFKTIYCHLKKESIVVKATDIVKAGQKIAEADNTGLSTGSHLHWGLKPVYQGEQEWQWSNLEQNNGYFGAIDPTPYLVGYPPKPKIDLQSVLTYGMRNSSEVRKLQEILKNYGFLKKHVPITGNYLEETRKAVFAFQVQHEVASWADLYFLQGRRVGKATLKKIRELLGLDSP